MSDDIEVLTDILRQMLDAIRVIESVSEPQFMTDPIHQGAVLYYLIVLGEASSDILRNHAEHIDQIESYPFGDARGLRNRLAHDYSQISLEIVWRTVANQLPGFRRSLEALLAALEPPAR